MERWTRAVIANRKKVLAAWIVLFALGGYGASHLGELLTNRFSVPGSDAERGLDVLKERFNERADGAFTLVFQSRRPIVVASRNGGPPSATLSPAFRAEATRAVAGASSAVEGAKPVPSSTPPPTSPTPRSTPRCRIRMRPRRPRRSAPRRPPCRGSPPT